MCWLVVGALCRGGRRLAAQSWSASSGAGQDLGGAGTHWEQTSGCPGCSLLRLSIVGSFSWIIASWPGRPWAKVGGERCGQAAVTLQTWPREAAPRQNARERENSRFHLTCWGAGGGGQRRGARAEMQSFFKKRSIYGCAEFWLPWVGFL